MKRILFFLFLLSKLSAQQTGIVTIHFPSMAEQTFYKLYPSATSSVPVYTVSSMEEFDTLLEPVFEYGGNPFIAFRCDTQLNGHFYIRDYKNPHKGFWLAPSEELAFLSWTQWFEEFGRVISSSGNPIRTNPSDTARILKRSCDCILFGLDSISGDWMKISYDETCEEYYLFSCPDEKSNLPGWIRWRNGDEIFAEVYIAE